MPELPDLEVVKEMLSGVLPGLAITRAEVGRPIVVRDLAQSPLAGRRVQAVGRLGKFLTRQEFVAGIGNAYADEIVFRAGISPFRPRPRLTASEIDRLQRAMREVLQEAIGILRGRLGLGQMHVEVRDFLQVHGRGGQPCPRCGQAISELRARQRLTSFCRRCQPGTLVRN